MSAGVLQGAQNLYTNHDKCAQLTCISIFQSVIPGSLVNRF